MKALQATIGRRFFGLSLRALDPNRNSMCLILMVRAKASARPLLEAAARSLTPPALRLDVSRAPRWPWVRPTHVQAAVSETGGCACSLLADDAEWDAEFWSIRPENLEPLVRTLAAVATSELDEFTVEALWIGEQAAVERRISFEELLVLVRVGRLGTRTRYVVRDTP